jgi:hypothetical protein
VSGEQQPVCRRLPHNGSCILQHPIMSHSN